MQPSEIKIITFLAVQMGENYTTPHDICAVIDIEKNTATYHNRVVDLGTINFKEEISVCRSSDDNGLCMKLKYSTVEISIPTWLSGLEFLSNQTAYKWLWGFGCSKEAPELWQRFLVYVQDEGLKLGYIRLMNTKTFRSEIRKSFFQQIESWLETSPEERKFKSPLSPKQANMLVDRYTDRDAKRKSSNLYYSGRYA